MSAQYRDSTVRRLVQEQDVVSDENSREKLQNVLADSTAIYKRRFRDASGQLFETEFDIDSGRSQPEVRRSEVMHFDSFGFIFIG